MAVLKIIRAFYHRPAYIGGLEGGSNEESIAIFPANWYLETDIDTALVDLEAELISIRGGSGTDEFVGWEEKDLDTGD